MSTEIAIGSTVIRSSKTAKNGRTGQVIEVQADHIRVHWTRTAKGNPMSQKSWSFASDLTEIGKNRAVASVHKKMTYIMEQVERGPLVEAERTELMGILERVKGESMWAIGIRGYLDGPRGHDEEFIRGLADQCVDDIFTMTCIVGQAAVIYLLRTIQN